MRNRNSQEAFSKMLTYVLGRRPEEFGLIPDPAGYVKVKDLLKALSEEEGWRHVRKSHLDEIRLVISPVPFEMDGLVIRAVNREHLLQYQICKEPPFQLYTCVRKNAYPVVLNKGLSSNIYPYIVLSDNTAMAERLGRRFTDSPILLTVSGSKMKALGIQFLSADGPFYLVERLPPDCFTGPPLPKAREDKKPKETAMAEPKDKMPGSYLVDLSDYPHNPRGDRKRDKKLDWKRERKRMNRRGQGKGGWE